MVSADEFSDLNLDVTDLRFLCGYALIQALSSNTVFEELANLNMSHHPEADLERMEQEVLSEQEASSNFTQVQVLM
jgi:hypothetical protein